MTKILDMKLIEKDLLCFVNIYQMIMMTNAMKIVKLKKMMRILGSVESLQHKYQCKNAPCQLIKIHRKPLFKHNYIVIQILFIILITKYNTKPPYINNMYRDYFTSFV